MFTTSRSVKAAATALLAAGLSLSAAGTASAQDVSARANPPFIGISPTSQSVTSGGTASWGVATVDGTAPVRVTISFGDGTTGSHAGGQFNIAHVYRYCAARTHTYGQRFTVTDAQGRTDSVTSTVKVTYSGPLCG